MLRQDLKALGCRVREFDLLEKAQNWVSKHSDRCLIIEQKVAPELDRLCPNCILLSALHGHQEDYPFQVLPKPYSLQQLAEACAQFAHPKVVLQAHNTQTI